MAQSASDATASFAVDLGITGVADAKSAADSLADLQRKIQGDTDAIAGMQKALRLLKGDSAQNATQIKDLTDKIKASKAAVASSTRDFLALGGAFTKGKPDASALAGVLEQLKGSIAATGSPLGGLVSGFERLKTVFGSGALAGAAVGVSLALVALAAAAGAAILAVGRFAIAAADARRTEELQLEGMTKLRFGLYGLAGGYQIAADSSQFLQTQIDRVASKVPLARSEVAQYEAQLYKMGLRSGNLQAALEGATIVASAQGDQAAQAFIGMAVGAGMAGGSIRRLADDAKARLGGIVARQMLSLDVQSRKLHESFAFLFSGVKLEGFLNGLNKVTELFSANTESGKALKQILETIFNPFFSNAEGAGLIIRRFFQGMIIGAQRVLIALFPVRLWLHKTFKDSSLLEGMNAQRAAVMLGVGAVLALAAAFGVLAISVIGVASPFIVAGLAIAGIVYVAKKAYDAIMSISWSELGASISHGIAQGITDGAAWVVQSIKNLGQRAVKAFKDELGIHSPSRLFRAEGFQLGAGAGLGVDDSAPLVQRAVVRMAAPLPDVYAEASAPYAGSAPAPRGGGIHVNGPLIGSVTLQTSEREPQAQIQDFARHLVTQLQAEISQLGEPA